MRYRIGLIGLGNMATGLLEGWNNKNRPLDESIGFDIRKERCLFIEERFKIKIAKDISEVSESDIIVIAVKPQDAKKINLFIPKESLIVSIMAGISIKRLESIFPDRAIVRIMPNLLCGINKSFIPFTTNEMVDDDKKRLFIDWFSDFGPVSDIPESYMSVMTALNGSGPGFVAYLMEGFIDGAVCEGLPYDTALKLTLSIFEGTAELIKKNMVTPNSFRSNVTSSGGTTAKGIYALEKMGVKGALYDMVRFSSERARELESKD
ncbi:MAG: pyrroline-5-carboxylate reductase [bacterium]